MHRPAPINKNLFFKALELARNDHYEDAIKAFQASLRADPNDAETHYSLGLMFLLTGKKDAAMEEYRLLKTLDDELGKRLLDFISPPRQFSLEV
jgi:tetratricopeptide (TPR) repeat protein